MEPRNDTPEAFLKPYNSAESEPRILEAWEASGYANPDVMIEKGLTKSDAEPYSIVLPPPNVTGTLHMGHAAMLAIEDILIRYHRMRGYRTLWLPGTDSAALATQAKVEEMIYRAEKKSRHDIGREELLKRIDAFTEESKATIIDQVKKMGSSLDWSRYAYTMDDQRYRAVMEAFVRMYDAGLIYRGDRIVNWDPKLQTTVSDDEVERVEQKTPFYYFQYGPFVIGTVRPETKFGDKYVVMHPDDARYKKFKQGQQIELEWINGPITATVIKDDAVDPEVGSGVMTITPAHSGIDFDIAKKHGLDVEQVIDERGILLPIAGEFAGQHIKKARTAIVEKCKAKGLLVKVDEDYVNTIATNSRGGGIIEPQIKRQWFINVNKEFTIPYSEIPGIESGSKTTLKEIMRRAVDQGAVKILPDRFEKIYYHWIDNLRDWNISRQIWFGHRIPAWTKGDEIKVQVESPGTEWEQDPDVLDTWFSSGLWTFSTLGWPITNRIDFDEKLVPLVKNGSKKKTYRLTDKKVVVGEIVETASAQTDEKFGYLQIRSITQTTLGSIDWQADGHEKYKNQDDLIATFKDYYPHRDVSTESPVWAYEYEYMETADLDIYHPTSVLETGYDIIFFWVARMILMSGFLRGQVPFKNVYLHGLVRDGQGRKMSKSLGNIIDPLTMIENTAQMPLASR
jgi:valyl-tRNA synthetase